MNTLKLFFTSFLILTSSFVISQSNSVFENNIVDHSNSGFVKNEIGVGFENYSKTSGLNGGNYLFLQYHYRLSHRLSLGSKLSSDLAPSTFDDLLAQVGFRYNTLPGESDFGQTFGLYYLRKLNENSTGEFLNLDISLISYIDDEFRLDILPIAVLYSFDEGEFSINYKFLGLSFLF